MRRQNQRGPSGGARSRAAVILVALVALSAGACGATQYPTPTPAPPSPSTPAYTVHVLNVSGPAVEVLAGGRTVATVPCGGGTDIRSAEAGLPPTPYEVVVRRTDDGSALGRTNVIAPADMAVQVRDATVAFGQAFTGGPSVAPDACARWSQQP